MNSHRRVSSIESLYEHEHFVQMYDNDEDLIENLGAFIRSGIRAKEPCVVIATVSHMLALDGYLIQKGIDIAEAKRAGLYFTADAAQTLSGFMTRIVPDRDRFNEAMGTLLQQTSRKGKVTRVYGEMVALLWSDDNHAGAICLEQLWNELAASHSFTLFCAYPMHYFERLGHNDLLSQVRRLHSAFVAPPPTVPSEPSLAADTQTPALAS